MDTTPTDEELAQRIHAFLEAHAKTAAAWDPDVDPPGERFNGPDSSMLWAAAERLRAGETPDAAWSSWGSGCYRPAGDTAARAEHDALVALVDARAKADRDPAPRL